MWNHQSLWTSGSHCGCNNVHICCVGVFFKLLSCVFRYSVTNSDLRTYSNPETREQLPMSVPIGKPLPNYLTYILNPDTKAPVRISSGYFVCMSLNYVFFRCHQVLKESFILVVLVCLSGTWISLLFQRKNCKKFACHLKLFLTMATQNLSSIAPEILSNSYLMATSFTSVALISR